mgnify:CR=1 FL=1
MKINDEEMLELLDFSTEEEKKAAIVRLAKKIDRRFSNQKVKRQRIDLHQAEELLEFEKHFIRDK